MTLTFIEIQDDAYFCPLIFPDFLPITELEFPYMKTTFSLLTFLFLSLSLLASGSDTLLIRKHFTKITKTAAYRNHKNIQTLNSIAAYIYDHFERYADSTYYQSYEVNGQEYKNVICVFGSDKLKTIVIGAHYDVCGDQEGADDNASGVIGLLELARMLQGKPLTHRLELVAYTLEEPPYFRSENMGSYVHAKSLHDKGTQVYGMLSVEMIGYFDDKKGSQGYPASILSIFYGKKANFIMVVNKWGKGKFARKFSRKFKQQPNIPVKRLTGPKIIEGLDWSDHLNYWTFGMSASMITDTAFNRNKNYHKKSDKMETLNIEKMAQVIDGLYAAVLEMK